MIQLQERDRKILRHCYEQQFLTMSHLIEFYFKGRHIGEPYRRVQELVEAGYLRKEHKAFSRLIRLTPEGKKIARSTSPWDFPKYSRFNLNYAVHDSLVTTVRLRLEELWDGEWKPAIVLRAESKRERASDAIGDGGFIFPSKKLAAIEVETLPQKRSTMIELLRNWERSRLDPNFLLFVFTSSAAFERVQTILREKELSLPILLIRLEDLLHSPPKPAWCTRGGLAIFNKRNF